MAGAARSWQLSGDASPWKGPLQGFEEIIVLGHHGPTVTIPAPYPWQCLYSLTAPGGNNHPFLLAQTHSWVPVQVVTSWSNTNKNICPVTTNSVSIPAVVMIAFATTNNHIYIFKATDATQMVWLGPLKKLVSATYIYDKDTELTTQSAI